NIEKKSNSYGFSWHEIGLVPKTLIRGAITSWLKGHLDLSFSAERNGMQLTQRYRTKGKFSLRSVRLEKAVFTFGSLVSILEYSLLWKSAQEYSLLRVRRTTSAMVSICRFSGILGYKYAKEIRSSVEYEAFTDIP
uniref:Maturase K n=1 Tax=Romanomermis culicivorax TaxID=13658 RepID=A0A915JWC2_ROMCU